MVVQTGSPTSPVRRGASPVHHGASPVRSGASPMCRGGGDDDRSPSPSIPLRKSRGRMKTTSAAAKSDSPPRRRTMTRSASRLPQPRAPTRAGPEAQVATSRR